MLLDKAIVVSNESHLIGTTYVVEEDLKALAKGNALRHEPGGPGGQPNLDIDVAVRGLAAAGNVVDADLRGHGVLSSRVEFGDEKSPQYWPRLASAGGWGYGEGLRVKYASLPRFTFDHDCITL